MGGALRRWGKGLAGVVAAAAARDGDRISLIDELGPVTTRELHERSSALALALAERGVGPGDGFGLLCRDHRFFAEAAVAAAKLGADLLLLNTSFSGPQLQDVLQREGARVLVHDAEFDGLVESTPDSCSASWRGRTSPTRAGRAGRADRRRARGRPRPAGRAGAHRAADVRHDRHAQGRAPAAEAPTSAIVSVLERIPLRRGDRHFVAAPLFHAWGFAHFGLGLLLGCEVVLRRRFDAEQTLATIARQRVTSVAMVPVMGQRMLALPDEVRARYDCSRLRLIALGGSAIPGDLAVRLMDEYGDVVHNAYGSSEVAIVSIAGARRPACRPRHRGPAGAGIELRLLDADGREVPAGEPGRIFVGSEAAFEGYTGGQTRSRSTG